MNKGGSTTISLKLYEYRGTCVACDSFKRLKRTKEVDDQMV